MPLHPGEDFEEHFLSASLISLGVIGDMSNIETIVGCGIADPTQSGKPEKEGCGSLKDFSK